ncbi:sigma factor [Micromonospora sp. 050-3]|uniref:sigma factor n=1 Tax=Micromonospora sp. 050-3 TaxID=2789265 RepID=UPI00397E6C4E
MTDQQKPLSAADRSYVAFVEVAWQRHIRLAMLLSGDRWRAEELLQDSLVKVYERWRRLSRLGDPHAYLRRALVNNHTSAWRRRRRESLFADVPDRAAAVGGVGPLPADKSPGETYGRYGQYPGTYDRLSLYGDGNGVLGAAEPDPAALFAALTRQNATVTENPDDTLHFTYAETSKDGSSSTAGDVTLDRAGRIATVALTLTWQSTAKGRLDTGTANSTLELFDYGTAVTVERPTDVVMMKD